MAQSFSWFVMLGLLLAASARAQEATPPPAPPAAPPAAAPAVQDSSASPTTAARELPATSLPAAQGSEPPSAPVMVQSPPPPPPPPAFPETRYDYRRTGRLPPPRLYAVEPRRRRLYGDAGAALAMGIGGNYRFRDDVGYARLGSSDRQTELDVFVSYDVWQPSAPLVIAAGVNYRYGSVGSDLSVATHGIVAELTARYTLAGWIFPHLRAALGVQTAQLEVSRDGVSLSDKATSPLGNLGAGFTLRTPPRMFETEAGRCSSLSLGLLVEAGYLFARAASFKAAPDSDSEVPQQSIDLGKLEQASPYLRLLGVVRF